MQLFVVLYFVESQIPHFKIMTPGYLLCPGVTLIPTPGPDE